MDAPNIFVFCFCLFLCFVVVVVVVVVVLIQESFLSLMNRLATLYK